jgi:hypothetical protein
MKKIYPVFVLLCAGMILSNCERAKLMPGEEEKQTATTVGETPSPTGSINVATIAIQTGDKAVNVSVEMAVSDEQRAKGLMGRTSLPANYGMWFVFPYDVQDPFWMKDTLIPLDMIFVGSDMKVVDVIASAEPQSERKLFPKAMYRYVLEVNGGYAAANGITVGNQVEQRIGPAQ